MKITYLGVQKNQGHYLFWGPLFGEPVVVFEVNFDISIKGVYSMKPALFYVSLPMIGVNEDNREILTVNEIEIAKSKIECQLKNI
jgi:hypothetical protein